MADPRVPYQFGQDVDDALVRSELDSLEQQVYGPRRPAPQAPRLGHLDNATLAMLRQMQGQAMPRPRNFGQGLAGGFVQGLVGQLGGDIAQRQQQYEGEVKSAEDEAEERKKFRAGAARDLAMERWRMHREQQRPASGDPNEWVDVTPEMLQWAAENDIAIAPGVKKIKATDLTRNKPVRAERDPGLAELTRISIEEKKRKMDEDAAAVSGMGAEIAAFKADPRLPARDPNRNAIIMETNRALAAQGLPYTHRTLVQLREEADRFSKTMNAPRPTQLRQAAVTAHEHLKQMEDFYDTYWPQAEKAMNSGAFGVVSKLIPKELRQSNKAVLWMAQNGYLGPKAAEDAAALVSTGDPVRREVEMVFSSGYAPFEAEIKKGFQRLDEARGPNGFKGQMRAMRGLIKKRVEVATKALPFYGGESNPYLLGVSPIGAWLEAEKEQVAPGMADMPLAKPEKPAADGGKAAKYR